MYSVYESLLVCIGFIYLCLWFKRTLDYLQKRNMDEQKHKVVFKLTLKMQYKAYSHNLSFLFFLISYNVNQEYTITSFRTRR